MNFLGYRTKVFPTHCGDIRLQNIRAVVFQTTYIAFSVLNYFGRNEISPNPASLLSFWTSSMGCGKSTVATCYPDIGSARRYWTTSQKSVPDHCFLALGTGIKRIKVSPTNSPANQIFSNAAPDLLVQYFIYLVLYFSWRARESVHPYWTDRQSASDLNLPNRRRVEAASPLPSRPEIPWCWNSARRRSQTSSIPSWWARVAWRGILPDRHERDNFSHHFFHMARRSESVTLDGAILME